MAECGQWLLEGQARWGKWFLKCQEPMELELDPNVSNGNSSPSPSVVMGGRGDFSGTSVQIGKPAKNLF